MTTIIPVILALIFIALMVLLIALPSIIACKRKHCNRKAIIALNVLTFLTVVGWIIATVWSMTDNVEKELAEKIQQSENPEAISESS